MLPSLREAADLYLKGGRAYLHGTTVMAAMLAALPGELAAHLAGGEVAVKSFKVMQETAQEGRLSGAAKAEDLTPSPAASLHLETPQGPYFMALHADPERPLARRQPGREAALVPAEPEMAGDYAGAVRLSGVKDHAALIEALVEANKRLHLATARAQGRPAPALRWVFLERLPLPALASLDGGDLTVQFQHQGLRAMGGRDYTYNRIAAGIPGLERPAVICFSLAEE